MDEKLALQLFTNDLREKFKKNVVMFNPPTLRDAYSLAKLAEAILAYTHPNMIHDSIHVELVDLVVEYKYDVVPMDPIIECEDLPLTYLSIDGAELVDPIEEYEALHPYYIHTNDVDFESSSIVD